MMLRLFVLAAALSASIPALAAAPAEEPMKCPLTAPYDPHNPFAQIIRGEKKQAIVYSDPLVVAFVPIGWDNPGHVLIVPVRHVANYFGTTRDEKLAMLELLERAKVLVDEKFAPAAYNVGINIGETAGQTIMHAHMHLIPRYTADVKNPRGGVRGVIPGKQFY